ncbi:uncharacterized protein LOC136031698 [Artemia franciscana]
MEVWNGISLAFWESLIASVQDFPYLYTKSDKRYKDTSLVENTWNHISSNLKDLGFKLEAGVELNGTCVKNKWFSLWTKYIREKSDVKKRSGSGSDKREKWILFHHLKFLDKLTQTRQQKFPRISNLELEDNKTDRFDTSQEYFSIQGISCDAYFTNDAPKCIDAKADTNDGDDAKAVTSLPFFTRKGPRSDKVVRNIIIGTSPSKFGNQSGSRMFVRNCQPQSRLVESEQGTTNMIFRSQSIPPSMDNTYMSDDQLGLQQNPGPYPYKHSTPSIKIPVQSARKLGCDLTKWGGRENCTSF